MRFKSFLAFCVSPLWKHGGFLLVMNGLYFGLVVVGALLAQMPNVQIFEWVPAEDVLNVSGGTFWLILSIFVFNLVVSGFFLTTGSGLVFFALPFGVMGWRALLWGAMLAQLASPEFFVAFPTLVLEGEGYVFAALAGVILGLSWLKPDWAYKGMNLRRSRAFREAISECLGLYVFVVVLFLVGALVETATVVSALEG